MKLFQLFFYILLISSATAQSDENSSVYGNNGGKYINSDGAKIYYEEYGEGSPVLLIHGNGGNIESMKNQIDFFKKEYRVIVADNRGHGKSDLSTDSLTYRQMAKDYEALAQSLELDSLNIIGWSDGGIIALLMGINQEVKIRRIVAMGANLRPDTTAVYPWAVNYVKDISNYVQQQIAANDKSEDWNLIKQHLNLLGKQPNISISELNSFATPTLIVAGDQDIIREEHTVEMFQNLQNAHLCILPGETHYVPEENPDLFNMMVNNFISKEFKRPDSNFTK